MDRAAPEGGPISLIAPCRFAANRSAANRSAAREA